MQTESTTRRTKGDGSLIAKPNAKGGETWFGRWRVGDREYLRKVGPKKLPGHKGLTKGEAEARFLAIRERVADAAGKEPKPVPEAARKTLAQVGEAIILAKRATGRKPATIEHYEYMTRVHIVPFFGVEDVDKIDRDYVRRFAAELESKGLSPKTRANALGTLHSLIEFAIDEEWATGENPVKRVAKPSQQGTDADIHFLIPEEVEALLRVVPDTPLGRVERVMYLTAAMTGLRQGELLALQWKDVDWTAQRIRVRRNYVRKQFGTPKSKRSSRSVPLANRVAAELDLLFQSAERQADDDLVFAHPLTGNPMDASNLLKHFKSALRQAGVREVRFHDLRHTFGTRMAARGVPMRALQEMLGHRDFATTLIYADYAPSASEAQWVEEAFATQAPEPVELTLH